MNKKLAIIILPVLLLFLTTGCFLTDWYNEKFGDVGETLPRTEVTFKVEPGDYTLDVEIADTEEEREIGLMNRDELGEDEGMLFVFDNEKIRTFWMKNTFIYLDLVFISADKTVVDIKENFESCYEGDACPKYRSRRDAQYVVEMNGGKAQEKGIKVGDNVEFEL